MLTMQSQQRDFWQTQTLPIQYHAVVLYGIVRLLGPLSFVRAGVVLWEYQRRCIQRDNGTMTRLFPSAQHVAVCSSHLSCEDGLACAALSRRWRGGAKLLLGPRRRVRDEIREYETPETRTAMDRRECSVTNAHYERIVLVAPRWNIAPM